MLPKYHNQYAVYENYWKNKYSITRVYAVLAQSSSIINTAGLIKCQVVQLSIRAINFLVNN